MGCLFNYRCSQGYELTFLLIFPYSFREASQNLGCLFYLFQILFKNSKINLTFNIDLTFTETYILHCTVRMKII